MEERLLPWQSTPRKGHYKRTPHFAPVIDADHEVRCPPMADRAVVYMLCQPVSDRPPEAPIYLCPENSRFEASKIKNICPEIADLRPEKSDLCPGHSGF